MIIFESGYSNEFDGPGNRLIYYLKGCNFRCSWCGAPESLDSRPQVMNYPGRRVTAGKEITTDEILKKALTARDFIDGVTFGGGEPTLQARELLPCVEALKAQGIHTAMESNASTPDYQYLATAVDFLFSDLKSVDPADYPSYLGVPERYCQIVKNNLCFAAEHQPNFVLRIPVVSQVNDSPEAQHNILFFCQQLLTLRPTGQLKIQLLRQHHLAEPKYQALGIDSPYAKIQPPAKQVLEEFAKQLNKAGLTAEIFG